MLESAIQVNVLRGLYLVLVEVGKVLKHPSPPPPHPSPYLPVS